MIKLCIGVSAAIVLVLLVRRALRVRFGAHAVYQMWLMVLKPPCLPPRCRP
ncbi:hypothetical protein LP419_12130 [Massilia sp. H-1]|nr:hypothetical protein LP419_12130 [Massilia sp. H-1]